MDISQATERVIFMLMTPSNKTSVPFSRAVALKLQECDSTSTFAEAGSYYVAGFKDGNRLVYAHFADKASYDRYCGHEPELSPQEQYEAYRNYNANRQPDAYELAWGQHR